MTGELPIRVSEVQNGSERIPSGGDSQCRGVCFRIVRVIAEKLSESIAEPGNMAFNMDLELKPKSCISSMFGQSPPLPAGALHDLSL